MLPKVLVPVALLAAVVSINLGIDFYMAVHHDDRRAIFLALIVSLIVAIGGLFLVEVL